MIRVYLDCDGVLADFDKRAIEILGCRPRDFENTEGEQALWDKLYCHEDFFESLEPMPDAHELIAGVLELGFHPTILTGVPKPEGGPGAINADPGKRKMIRRCFGDQYRVITCRSKDKYRHMEKKGDVLIDDWHKYRHKWQEAGGQFITHIDAKTSLRILKQYKEWVHEDWIWEDHVYDSLFEVT